MRAGYENNEVLRGVDARVGAGEIVAVIGPNGAGKSTLLKTIGGFCRAREGSVTLNGSNIANKPPHELALEGIAYVPQERKVFPDLTVRENLQMGGYAFPNDAAQRGIAAALEEFAFLKDKLEERAFALSGGQQQMLAMACALASKPNLLLLDEPSLGLAPKTARQIFEKIVAIRRSGASIMLVEQNARQAVSIADRTYVLENGRVAMQGGKELLRNEKLKRTYFGG